MALTYYIFPAGTTLSISEYLYELVLPPSTRPSGYGTKYLCPVLVNTVTGEEAMQVNDADDGYSFMIHPAAKDANIDAKTQGLVDAGLINATERDNLRNLVKSKRDNEEIATIAELMPGSYAGKTKAELEVIEGWFDDTIV